jgi:comEA protein
MKHWNRNWYLFSEKWGISRSEMRLFLLLSVVLFTLTATYYVIPESKSPFEAAYYDSIRVEFQERAIKARAADSLRLEKFLNPDAYIAKEQEKSPKKKSKSPQGKININTASEADWIELPGIGPAMAKRIIELREKNNGFKKLDDLLDVKGIGPKSFEKIKPYLTL